MKPNIHPDNYRTVLFFDSSANEGWLIRSCAETHGKTMVWILLPHPIPSIPASSATSTPKAVPANSTNVSNPSCHRLERTNNAGSVFTQNRQTTPPRLPNRQAQGQSLRHLQKQSAF